MQRLSESVALDEDALLILVGGDQKLARELAALSLNAIAQHEGFAVHALTFGYGQRHATEIQAAKKIARNAGVIQHRVVDIDLTVFGGSALTASTAVPKDRDLSALSLETKEIAVT